MVQCWCLLAERELRTYMSCADTSDYNGSALSSHRMICASSPSITETVWFINQNTWKGCLKTTYPVLHAFSSTYVMCVCLCVRASELLLLLVFHWSVLSSPPLACVDGVPLKLWRKGMWDLGFKNESHDGEKKKTTTKKTKHQKSQEGLDLLTEKCVASKPNQNPQLWLSLRGTAAACPPLTFAVISAAELGSQRRVLHFLNVLFVTKT